MTTLLGPHVEYRVHVPAYEGPLDLLLDLIEKSELDITEISLAAVTDQYLSYIRSTDIRPRDDLSAFLVIAARLVQLKSEALLPRPPQSEPVGTTETSLVDQVRLYKRIKEVGAWLSARQQAQLHTFLRVAPPPKVQPKLDPASLTLQSLLAAANDVQARSADKAPLGEVIAAPTITIRQRIQAIARRLNELQRSSFNSLFKQGATKVEIVVTFLALLELIKRYRVEVRQDSLFAEIQIERLQVLREDEDDLEFE